MFSINNKKLTPLTIHGCVTLLVLIYEPLLGVVLYVYVIRINRRVPSFSGGVVSSAGNLHCVFQHFTEQL